MNGSTYVYLDGRLLADVPSIAGVPSELHIRSVESIECGPPEFAPPPRKVFKVNHCGERWSVEDLDAKTQCYRAQTVRGTTTCGRPIRIERRLVVSRSLSGVFTYFDTGILHVERITVEIGEPEAARARECFGESRRFGGPR